MMRIDQFGHNIQFYLTSESRAVIMDDLKQGIPALYYPKPLHQVDLYADNKIKLPVTENFAKEF